MLASIARRIPGRVRKLNKYVRKHTNSSAVLLQSSKLSRPVGAAARNAESNYTDYSLYRLTEFSGPPAVTSAQTTATTCMCHAPQKHPSQHRLVQPGSLSVSNRHRAECCACLGNELHETVTGPCIDPAKHDHSNQCCVCTRVQSTVSCTTKEAQHNSKVCKAQGCIATLETAQYTHPTQPAHPAEPKSTPLHCVGLVMKQLQQTCWQ